MAEIVMILGDSGSGKTMSLRNFGQDELLIINVSGKRLPFKNHLPTVKTSDYKEICQVLNKKEYKTYVIDDSQYLMAFENFAQAHIKNYDKFTVFAQNFYKLLMFCKNMPDDTIVYLLHHTNNDDFGKIKPKTVGKMIDNQLCIEGLFNIVLLSTKIDDKYVFLTNNNGESVAKSPYLMFDNIIPNDLKQVDTIIREFWSI